MKGTGVLPPNGSLLGVPGAPRPPNGSIFGVPGTIMPPPGIMGVPGTTMPAGIIGVPGIKLAPGVIGILAETPGVMGTLAPGRFGVPGLATPDATPGNGVRGI